MNSEQRTPLRIIRYVIFGSTGVGKSTFGNILLGTNAFQTGDPYESSTKEPYSHFNTVNGVKIIVTDTVDLDDPLFEDEKILEDLARYFQNDLQGPINYFLLLQDYRCKFTYIMLKNIIMLLTSFVGQDPTKNIKIVLTHAKGTPEEHKKRICAQKEAILKVFEKFSPEYMEQVKKIPIFCVNNHPKPEKRTPVPSDISPFQPNPPPSIDPCRFSPKGYSLTEEIIVEEGFINKYTYDGFQIFATLVHRKRSRFTSFHKKTITYSAWENIDCKEPRQLCIQKAEFSEKHDDKPEIKNETSGNNKIKRTIYHSFKNKRILRLKYNKKEQQGEKENNGAVFYELTDTLNVDGRTIIFTWSKTEGDITTFYSDWYPDPDSEIKYELQEITRPFEEIKKNGSSEVKFFGEEMQKLKIEYKKDPSGQWKECKQVLEQEWHKTKTNQNITNNE